MANHSIIRITRADDIPVTALAVACRDVDVRNVKALIIGPPETPYEFGFFEFAVRFGKGIKPFCLEAEASAECRSTGIEYPGRAPTVTATTTNGGRCRFNPNIYAAGKVCLSILGTWRGERGEEWSSAQGLESILLSIQSLMSSNPYENEPGFEDAKADHDKKNIADYVAKIRHETLRVSVIQRLEEYLGLQADGTHDAIPKLNEDEQDDADADTFSDDSPPLFTPFKDLCKRRFLWYYDSYLLSIAAAEKEVNEGQPFALMPFETGGNTMDGKFLYPELRQRLGRIREMLVKETDRWIAEGLLAKRKEAGIAANLQRQYEQVVESYSRDSSVTLDIEQLDKNPFVWQLTYFGRPMTNLDGGLFKIKINFSVRFPEEQPRVLFVTPLFHHRISKDGVLCYFPTKSEEIKSHIEAIIEALEEENPAYDPRTMVHPEAAKLLWGNEDDKKMYSRRLRRAVQRSMEE